MNDVVSACFSRARPSCQLPSDTNAASAMAVSSTLQARRCEQAFADAEAHLYLAPPQRATRPGMIKFLIVLTLAAIVASLGTGLFHLVKDEGQSKRMVNALTVRIALSVLLFILLFVAWKGGMIQPHGVGALSRSG